MSYAAERWARAQVAGNARAKAVLIELANCFNEGTGLCCPSAASIARVTELKADTVFSAIAHLVRCGLIRKATSVGTSNRYILVGFNPDEWPAKKDDKPTPKTWHPRKRGTPENGVPTYHENGVTPYPEFGVLTGNRNREEEQGMFFVESPSGDFDDAPPAGVEDVTKKVDRGTARIPACPYKKLVDLYHEVCPMLPTVTVLTPGRKTQLKARWTEIYREEHCTSEAECLENFRFIFNRVAASRFLTGRTDPGHGRSRPFVANLDWLIKAANFVKVCENRYSN